MTWGRKGWILAWVSFCLMWIPIGVLIWYDVNGGSDNGFENLLIGAFLGLLVLFLLLLFGSIFGPLIAGMRENERIRATGTLASATVIAVADTAMYINHQPVLAITLSVRPPLEPAFETTVREVIPLSRIPQVQPGAQLQVYYLSGTTRVALPG